MRLSILQSLFEKQMSHPEITPLSSTPLVVERSISHSRCEPILHPTSTAHSKSRSQLAALPVARWSVTQKQSPPPTSMDSLDLETARSCDGATPNPIPSPD